MTERKRRSLVLDHFAALFGQRARHPVEYLEKGWSADPFVRGGYSGYTAPGVLSSLGDALAAPVGRLHWAGTETAAEYQGYIEGAIRSGERAAAEVLAALARSGATV
jgi:monoamine oxidase